MAGLPWLIVFALLSAWSVSRGHRAWLVVIWLTCFGIGVGQTTVGQQFYGLITQVLTSVWGVIVSTLQSLAS